jgi:uncharacterized protein YigE (DUF2233 family)
MRQTLFACLLAASFACAAQREGGCTVVRVDADKLRLFWRDDHGRPLDRLAAWLDGALSSLYAPGLGATTV